MSARRLVLLALLVGALLRLWAPGLRPLHHDEGVNTLFLDAILERGEWRYDPANYHGPALYALAAPFVGLTGWNPLALRAVSILSSWLTLLLVWRLRPLVGETAAAVAVWLLAVSPGAVYYGRDFIHESLLVMCTTAAVVYALDWVREPARSSLLLLALALALGFATKETLAIHLVALGGAMLLPLIHAELRARALELARRAWSDRRGLLLALLVGALLLALLMSSLGTNPRGVVDFFRAYLLWLDTGTEGASGHEKPVGYYFELLAGPERVLGALGLLGLLQVAWRPRPGRLFLAGWAGLTLLGYSLLPYKTPWLLLNALVPLALLGGALAAEALEGAPRLRPVLLLVVALLAAVQLHDSWSVNFDRYDDDRVPYVYSQTVREFMGVVEALDGVASQQGDPGELVVAVYSPEHFPLNFYLLRAGVRRVGYWGEVRPVPEARLLVARADQRDQLAGALSRPFMLREHMLRPGVRLLVGVPLELFGPRFGEGWERLEPAPGDAAGSGG